MRYLLLDTWDFNEVYKEVTLYELAELYGVDVRKVESKVSLGKLIDNRYVPVEDFKEGVKDEEYFDQLIGEYRGKRAYITPNAEIYVIHNNGKKTHHSIYKKHGEEVYVVKIFYHEYNISTLMGKYYFKGFDTKKHLIIRKDKKKGYEIDNCKMVNKAKYNKITGFMSNKNQRVGLYENNKLVKIYKSARQVNDLGICSQTVCDYCNGKVKKPMYDLRWLDKKNQCA